MIPRPPSLRDIRRDQEDEARRREQQTNSRKSDNTTVSSGGKFDVDGNFNVRNGGIGTIESGGKMNVQGALDITDDGQINAVGEGRHRFTREIVKVTASLANRLMTNLWESVTYLQAGLYFNTGGESRGALDPRVVSADGKSVSTISSVEKLLYGPQVGPNIMARGTYTAGPDFAGIGATAWDDSINPGGGDGVAGLRGAGSMGVSPRDISILLTNRTDGPDGIPSGAAIWMRGDLEEGMLRIYTRNGLDVEGTFTVNGQPVGGAVTSVAGKTGDVLLAKGDVGLGSVDNTSDLAKPVSNATQTALNGKSATTHTHAAATTAAAGFMSAADKVKLDGIPPGGTMVSLYIATGSKANFATGDQAMATPVYQASGSTSNLGTPGLGQITITETGVYNIACSVALFADVAMNSIKPATGRSFVDIADSSGAAYSRTAIPVGEDQATGNHAGLYLTAGTVLKFNLIQTTGGTAYYRARIWITKHP